MSNYKTFMGAFGKVFLGAVLTYQIIYWTWLKLETDESRVEKNGTKSRSYYLHYYHANSISRGNGQPGEKGSGAGGCPEVIICLCREGFCKHCTIVDSTI
jgi:hypothetical protein